MTILSSFNNDKNYNFKTIAIIIVVVSILVLLFHRIINNNWEDVEHYYAQFQMLVEGSVPYKDFVFEYPPLMLLFISIPGIIPGNIDVYCTIFFCISVMFYILTTYYIFRILDKFEINNKIASIVIVLTLLLIGVRVLLRNDIFAMFFVISSIYYYCEKRYELSFVLLSLGVMTKIFPIILALAFVIPFIADKKIISVAKYTIISIGICFLISLPFIILDSNSAFAYLTYHSDRGLQVESVASSIILFINLFVHIADPSSGYGSINISGQIPDTIAIVIVPLTIILLITFSVLCLYKYNKAKSVDPNRTVILAGTTMMLILVVFNKVFSEQYMLWIMLLVAILLCLIKKSEYYDTLIIATITSLVFSLLASSVFAPSLNNIEILGTILLLIRNISVIIILCYSVIITYYFLNKIQTSSIIINEQ